MIITKKSTLTGIVHTMDLPVTQKQLDRIADGELIQRVLPTLSASEREFLISGTTDEEWKQYFPPEEE